MHLQVLVAACSGFVKEDIRVGVLFNKLMWVGGCWKGK